MLRILEEAVRAFEERMDDVKEMNIICTYSKCVTERDGQKMDKVVFNIYILGVSSVFEYTKSEPIIVDFLTLTT